MHLDGFEQIYTCSGDVLSISGNGVRSSPHAGCKIAWMITNVIMILNSSVITFENGPAKLS